MVQNEPMSFCCSDVSAPDNKHESLPIIHVPILIELGGGVGVRDRRREGNEGEDGGLLRCIMVVFCLQLTKGLRVVEKKL